MKFDRVFFLAARSLPFFLRRHLLIQPIASSLAFRNKRWRCWNKDVPMPLILFRLRNLGSAIIAEVGERHSANLRSPSKIGDGAPLGAVFKDRRFTGELFQPAHPAAIQCNPHSLVARFGTAKSKCLRSLHLHSRDARRTKHRIAGKLRLCSDAIARRHATVRHDRHWCGSGNRGYDAAQSCSGDSAAGWNRVALMNEPFSGAIAR